MKVYIVKFQFTFVTLSSFVNCVLDFIESITSNYMYLRNTL